MVNETPPERLTVGELRAALEAADPDQVALGYGDLAGLSATVPRGMAVIFAVKID